MSNTVILIRFEMSAVGQDVSSWNVGAANDFAGMPTETEKPGKRSCPDANGGLFHERGICLILEIGGARSGIIDCTYF